MKIGIFLFHRDLRVYDNLAYNKLAEVCDEIYPIFILDKRQIDKKQNKYFGYNSFYFMLKSLRELQNEIPLTVYYGISYDVLRRLAKSLRDKGRIVYFGYNRDYTPFAVKRDSELDSLFEKDKIISYDDYRLSSPIMKPYRKFTPFYNAAKQGKIAACVTAHPKSLKGNSGVSLSDLIKKTQKFISEVQEPGREAALKILKKLPQILADYKTTRDFLGPTSRLSPHLKFGTVSVREVYHAVREMDLTSPKKEIFIRQLYWRDFYLQIVLHFPNVLASSGAARNMLKISPKWKFNQEYFDAWCRGKTGVPIVDAGMRQLLTEGYMHNRARMIVASFLTKDLHIEWTYGEEFFAQHLADYDPANNNGGWQWSASTGADSQPYFRMFNPWTQGKKFDPDCSYIKKYCPELSKFSAKQIHNGEVTKPIVDHAAERELTFKLYAS